MPDHTRSPLPPGVKIDEDGSWTVGGTKLTAEQIKSVMEGLSAEGRAVPLQTPDQPWENIKELGQRLVTIAANKDGPGLVVAMVELTSNTPDALGLRVKEEGEVNPDDDVPVVQQQGLVEAAVAAGQVRQTWKVESHNSNQNGAALVQEGQRFGEALKLRDGLRDCVATVGTSVTTLARTLHKKVKAVDSSVENALPRNHALAQACAPMRRYMTLRHDKAQITRRSNEARDAQVRADVTEEVFSSAKAAAKEEIRSDLASQIGGALEQIE